MAQMLILSTNEGIVTFTNPCLLNIPSFVTCKCTKLWSLGKEHLWFAAGLATATASPICAKQDLSDEVSLRTMQQGKARHTSS